MRILVYDYSGHAFPAQLSRRLASRKYEVLHLYSRSVPTPQEVITKSETDLPTLRFSGIQFAHVIEKQAFLRRYFQKRSYGLGFELQALQGCESLLNRFAYVYVECTFVGLYAGQALADEVIAWLRERGFRLSGTYNPTTDREGRVVQADFLFSRE